MNEEYMSIRNRMQEYYDSGLTLDYSTRVKTLKKLKAVISSWEDRLGEAMMTDLGKSPFESYETEIGLTQAEISHTLKHLRSWMKPKKVSTPLAHFPSKSYILKQPKGVVLVMSPWNYPVMLALVQAAVSS